MARHHATSGEAIRLRRREEADAQTVALAKTPSFEAIHLVVRANEAIPLHHVEGSVTLYCIEGAVALVVNDEMSELHVGDWIYLAPGVPHALHGIEDSGVLLTILFDADLPE